MRPRSIIQFERIYLISLALVILQQAVAFFMARDFFGRMAGGAELPAGAGGIFTGVLAGSMIIGLLFAVGIPLLLWWLAARQRQEVAKWLLLVVSVLSVLGWVIGLVFILLMPSGAELEGLAAMQGIILVIDGLAEVLGIVALTFLFRRDATEWFRTRGPNVNADVFR